MVELSFAGPTGSTRALQFRTNKMRSGVGQPLVLALDVAVLVGISTNVVDLDRAVTDELPKQALPVRLGTLSHERH